MIPNRYYEFLAASLIVGENSPILRDLRIYQVSFLRKSLRENQNLKVVELRGIYEGTKPDIKRRLKFDSDRIIETSHTLPNGISQIVTLVDKADRVHISDPLFNDEEFAYNKNVWQKTLSSRIDRMMTLIRILHMNQQEDIPLLVDDFPNIAGVFIMHPEVLKKGISDG
jgi:hypothetical protein